jgi:hypothetical protein
MVPELSPVLLSEKIIGSKATAHEKALGIIALCGIISTRMIYPAKLIDLENNIL